MGKNGNTNTLEGANRKRQRRENLEKAVLGTVAAVGMVGVSLVAPNVLGAMGTLGMLPRPGRKQAIERARDRLVTKGLLRYEGRNLRLTKKGEAALKRIELLDYAVRKPRRWDGKWRVLIFDIPEYRRGLREKVRRTLRAIGFAHLQHSVWIYPYDCEDLMTLLKADFKIGRDMRYLIADSIEYDQAYREIFGLKFV
jgi:hypothetical protein